MSPHAPAAIDDFWWAEPALKARLLAEPAAVLAERGITVPAHLPPHVLLEVARIVMLLWVDGRIVPVDRFHIDPHDEGLLFGRGVWESTRTIGGMPWLWPQHLARLIRTCELLDMPVDSRRLPDEQAVFDYVRMLSPQDVVLRLNVTAGRPGRPGMVWMSAALRPFPPAQVRLQSRKTTVVGRDPYSLWKTFHYAHRLRTGKLAHDAGFDSSLMIDDAGNIQEAAHANIFLRMPEGWLTPMAENGLFLPGTVRQHILDHAPIRAREAVIPLARVAEASEAFVTNSNVGIVPVTRIDGRDFQPGPETQQLARWLDPAAGPVANPVKLV